MFSTTLSDYNLTLVVHTCIRDWCLELVSKIRENSSDFKAKILGAISIDAQISHLILHDLISH